MKKQIIFTTLCGCIALQTFMLSACSGDSTAKANSQDCTISAESEITSGTSDDSQSWEISFDNIPWGADFASVKQMLPDLELSGITYEEMSPDSISRDSTKLLVTLLVKLLYVLHQINFCYVIRTTVLSLKATI